MLKRFLYITLAFMSFQTTAQDLIVTKGGDSLRVRIVDELSSAIFYQIPLKNGKMAEQRIFKTMVADFKYNHFAIEPDRRIMEESSGEEGVGSFDNYLKWRNGASWGIWRPTEFNSFGTSEMASYLYKLQKGSWLNATTSYYIVESLGMGLDYHRLGARNQKTNLEYIDADGNKITGRVFDNRALHFLNPSLTLRKIFKFDSFVSLKLGGGPVWYHTTTMRDKIIESSTRGWSGTATLAFDRMQGNTAIGFDSGVSLAGHVAYVALPNQTPNIRYGVTLGIMLYKIPKYLKLTSY